MSNQLSSLRKFAVPAMVVLTLAICFNNCSKSGSSTPGTAASTATGGVGSSVPTAGQTGLIPISPAPTPAPAPSPQPAPAPMPAPSPGSGGGAVTPLAISPATAQSEPYIPVTFTLSGGVAPYVVTGDFTMTIPRAGSAPLLGYLPGVYNAVITDAAGTKVSVKLTVTGTLAPAIAVADQNYVVNGVANWNYYYTTELEQSLHHQLTDVANGFPVYALTPPSHVRPVYICDNGAPRQFLSPDPKCEGHPGYPFLGYLYDSPTAIPGFKLKALIRTYNAATNLHRVQTDDVPVPDGFKADGVILGYVPPKAPPEWCGRWLKCDK